MKLNHFNTNSNYNSVYLSMSRENLDKNFLDFDLHPGHKKISSKLNQI